MKNIWNIYPYASISIDCTWIDWLNAVLRTIYTKENSRQVAFQINRLFSKDENVLTFSSVRTSLDLYIQAKGFKPGMEVIMSSINIPDVVKILRLHGLIPVPVDIDIDTLKTTPERIEEAITPRTCMIIISYVYAAKYSIQDIVAVAKKHSLPIYEDAAEAFVGLSYTGDPNANVTSFSFGPIKTCTGFGGCVSIVRDSMETLSKMKQIHATYPVQKTSVYLKKLLKSAVGKLVLNNRTMNYSIRPVLMAMKINYKKAVVKLMRGFPPEQSGLEKYRIQPCTAMLSFIYKRLACFNEPQFWKETENLIVSHM
jgi:hypothetical protein